MIREDTMFRAQKYMLERFRTGRLEEHWTEDMSSAVEDWRFRRPEN